MINNIEHDTNVYTKETEHVLNMTPLTCMHTLKYIQSTKNSNHCFRLRHKNLITSATLLKRPFAAISRPYIFILPPSFLSPLLLI